MVAMQDRFDPSRVFEPELWARLAAGEPYQLKPKCILDRSCYCEVSQPCITHLKVILKPHHRQCVEDVLQYRGAMSQESCNIDCSSCFIGLHVLSVLHAESTWGVLTAGCRVLAAGGSSDTCLVLMAVLLNCQRDATDNTSVWATAHVHPWT